MINDNSAEKQEKIKNRIFKQPAFGLHQGRIVLPIERNLQGENCKN